MADEYNPDIVSVVDEDGVEHTFEMLDAIETDTERYVALIPAYDNSTEIIEDDGELIILKVVVENGEEFLSPIEDGEEFDEIGQIFEERLSDMFDIEPMIPEQ